MQRKLDPEVPVQPHAVEIGIFCHLKEAGWKAVNLAQHASHGSSVLVNYQC
jgi:hypothetical protein